MLTDAAVRKLRPSPKRREIPDKGARGLILVIQPSGTKSWAVRFRRPDGRPAKLTLGSVDINGIESEDEPVIGGHHSLASARRLAAEVQRQRALGRDVIADHAAEKRRRASFLGDNARNTFRAAAQNYIEQGRRTKNKNRGWRSSASTLGLNYPGDDGETTIIKNSLVDRWRARAVAEITADDIYALVDEARSHGIPGRGVRAAGDSEARAREMASTLSAMFNWLHRKRRIKSNPCIGLDRPAPPFARDRVLNTDPRKRGADELRWFWAATDGIGYPFGPVLKLLLLTGARRGEVARMTWDELSDDLSTWALAASRTKNGRPHDVPLSPLVRDILASLPRFLSKEGYVFTTNGRTPISGFSKIKRRLDLDMNAAARTNAEAEVAKIEIPPWRIHDLRRTAATGMAEIGIAPHIVEACLNHISGARAGVAGTYNRAAYAEEKRRALERWAEHLMATINGQKKLNIVELESIDQRLRA